MTSSEIIEEILHEAYRLGIQDKVFEIAISLVDSGIDRDVAYERAFMLALL